MVKCHANNVKMFKFTIIFLPFNSRYDKVLKDGMPDWRSALYYYRRYRKMGLAEMIGLVFVIFTVAQYIVSWAVYAEKKYTAVSLLTTCSNHKKCLIDLI